MKNITLNNGVEMPIIGFGVYQIPPQQCEQAVLEAINMGYRSIDTAQAYYNEEEVGNAIRKSGIERSQLFITPKVWISNAGHQKAKPPTKESLRKLQTTTIDLLLIHQPFGDYYGTYRAMEEVYAEGRARAIGVSNFYPDRYLDLTLNVMIKPAVNQMETHVFFQQQELQTLMQEYGTALMSWGPFAEGKNNLFQNQTLTSIGSKYNKTAAQVALRFLVQRDIIVIPKSIRPERMRENLDIFNFSLTAEEMEQIAQLNGGHSLFLDHRDPETVKFLNAFGK